MINENKIKEVIQKILNEETSKVSRQEFGRVQYKIEEMESSLNETMKELRKLEDTIPMGLSTIVKNRLQDIETNLSSSQKLLTQLKYKIKQHKKSLYTQNIVEKKK